MKCVIGCLLSLFFLQSCLTTEPLKLENDFTPNIINDDWELSSLEEEGFDKAKLEKAYDLFFSEEEGFRTAVSLLIIRNGNIIAEAYCRNEDDDARLNNIKSATKSVTSILFGQAISDGYLDEDLTKTIGDYLPEYVQKYPEQTAVSVFNLLTMQSGIEYSNQMNTGELLVDKPNNSIDYILSQPIKFEQGTQFDYHDGNTHLLGAIIQEQTGKTLAEYATEKIFGPLNINNFVWEQHVDGLNYGAFGLYLTPRDFAKFGQLILNNGIWKGNELVDDVWIQQSVLEYVTSEEGPYGFQWWLRPEFNAFSSAGHGGQFTYIFPNEELLIVYTAEPTVINHEYGTDFNDFEKIVQLIIEAME